MMPRLQAEEQIAGVDVAALGSGSYEPATSQAKMTRLRETAHGEAQQRVAANPAQLAGMGIGIRIQKAPSDG